MIKKKPGINLAKKKTKQKKQKTKQKTPLWFEGYLITI